MLRIDINLLFTAINLLVLYIGVRLFLFKPIRKILKQRQDEVEQNFAAAEAAKAEGLALEEKHQHFLTDMEAERADAVAKAQTQAKAEYQRIVDDAKTQAKGILAQAETDAQTRSDEVLRQAQHQISDIILSATSKVTVGGDSADGDLYDAFLRKVGESDDEKRD